MWFRIPPMLPTTLAALAAAPPALAQSGDDLIAVEVATVGVDLASRTPIALLRDRTWGQLVPIWIGTEEAQAIARVLQGIEPARPMTHDLLASVIREMGGTVEEVAVHGVREDVYLGRVRIRVGAGPAAEIREVDSRPSDALALALRTDAVIRVAPSLIEAAPEVDFVAFEGAAEVVRALGMTVAPLTAERRREFSAPDRRGVVVLNVSEELAALGLRRGDLLVDVNGEVPAAPLTFLQALGRARPNAPIRIVYVRDGEDVLLEIPPGALGRPEGPRRRT